MNGQIINYLIFENCFELRYSKFEILEEIVPELRQNIITGDWVVIAPERAKRPSDFITSDTIKTQNKGTCPFCIDKSEYKRRIKRFDTKNIWVIENKYPAFIEVAAKDIIRSYKVENDFYRARPSTGGHDVVVIKDHDIDMPKFTRQIWYELLLTFSARYKYFDENCNVAYTMPIYNHNQAAGASIEHPHAQIFASNIIPNLISKEVHHTEKYFEHNGSCAFCDLIKHEQKFKKRIIFENSNFIAFTFYAARFPFEIWILPKNHASKFENETKSLYLSLSECLIDVFGKLDSTLNDPPVNFFFHTTPNTITNSDYYHWHIEIAPRVTGYGGYEMGSGNVINVVSPEQTAYYLKDKTKKTKVWEGQEK